MNKCSSYHRKPTLRYTYNIYTGEPIAHNIEVGVCWGTRECDECSCGGDRTKCDFYPDVREKAKKDKKEVVKGIPIDLATLYDWYISSVNACDTPVWTEEHLEELFNDFYLIPKEKEL